jgi:Tol biopolymer transport system component
MFKFASKFIIASAILLAACAQAQPATPTITPTAAATPEPTVSLPGLAGRLIYTQGAQGLGQYDFASGSQSTLFAPPPLGSVSSADVSPDGTQIAFSYAPPPSDPTQAGYTDLYLLPVAGGDPTLLLDAVAGDIVAWPKWSPDGAWVYYSHIVAVGNAYQRGDYGLQLERIPASGGDPQLIIPNAFWGRVSPDGTKIAYLDVTNPLDQLMVANVDGSDPQVIVPDDLFAALDALTWSPDGEYILFSAVTYGPRPDESLLNWLFGVQIASAHDTPSDLWRVPASGGEPEQLTTVQDFGLYPSYSPDAEYIALLRGSGVYIMIPDGSLMQRQLPQGPAGTINWIP